MALADDFTPTQNRMFNLLSDGSIHSKEELHACLDDELSEQNMVPFHICNMRKVIRPKGLDVVSERNAGYRLVRLLRSPYKE